MASVSERNGGIRSWGELCKKTKDLKSDRKLRAELIGIDPKTEAEMNAQERRLRQIYEWLDGGNNKKVVTEVDRMLKKNSSFTCAKVLKALALIRMNKPDESRQLLVPVAEEIPTDDATIQALSICYRELDEPHSLSAILEAACQKEKSEELLTHCFMAQVRVQDYKKMHLTARTLYKTYNKTTYFGWYVASLVLKSENTIGPLEQAEALSLDVAGRLMQIFAGEQKTPLEDNMLDLYVRILCKRAQWQTIVDVLKECGYPSLNWRNDDFHVFYTLALERLGAYDELFDYLKSTYLKNKEEYALLKQIIEVFGKRDYEKVDTLMAHLLEECPNRAVALADLYFSLNCVNDESRLERIGRDLKISIQYTVDKPSFYSDLSDYFKLVDREVQFNVVTAAAPSPDKGHNFDKISKIIRDVNFETISKNYIDVKDAELSRIQQANRCFGKYLVCDKLMDSLRTEENLRTKESDYHDQYIVVAAASLLDEFCKSSKLQENGDLESYLKAHPWTKLSDKDCTELINLKETLIREQQKKENHVSVNDVAESMEEHLALIAKNGHGHFQAKESLVLYAICLLEFGLARSPYNYSMRIMLSKAYASCGAVGQAIKVIQGLDLKHVQWDTLGYLILPQALTSGTYYEVMKMLVLAESMYTSYKREGMEHVIGSYKYGSFSKIQEFLNFRTQLLESIQCGTVLVEKRLLEFLMFSKSPQDLQKQAETLVRDPVNDWLRNLQRSDNRDFTVLQPFDEDMDFKAISDTTADLDYHMFRLRLSLLFIISKLIVNYNKLESDEEEGINRLIKSYEKRLEAWKKIEVQKNPKNPLFHAIVPHRAARYFDISAPFYILEQIKLVRAILLDREKPNLDLLQLEMKEHLDALLKILRQNYDYLVENKYAVNIEESITDFHWVLETFSFTRILLEIGVMITKGFYESSKSKSKQKERANQYQTFKKGLGPLIRVILEKFKDLNECFTSFINTLKLRPIPRLSYMTASMKEMLDDSFISAALPSTFDIAQRNIRESHLTQLEEMRKISVVLVDYIRNISESR